MLRKRTPTADPGLVVEYNNASGGVSFWQRDDNHSLADCRGISTADYIHAMYGFIRQAKCRDVLMVGCGGGTLATMLRRVGVKVTIVDIDGRSFDIATTYFHLPASVECHIADGATFLKRTMRKYDAVVLDAYSDNEIPRHMRKQKFFNLVRSRLKPRGVVLVNLIVRDDDDRTPDRIARMMQKTWRRVRLLDAVGHEGRNAVGIAGAVTNLKRPRLLMRPKCYAKTLVRDLKQFDFRPVRA
jgi:spermidine synthase